MVEGQGRVYVMGREQVVEVVVLPWSDRFHFLMDRSLDVDSALRVLLFLSDLSLHPSLSLSLSKDDSKALSAAQSLALSRAIDLFLSSNSSPSGPFSLSFLSNLFILFLLHKNNH